MQKKTKKKMKKNVSNNNSRDTYNKDNKLDYKNKILKSIIIILRKKIITKILILINIVMKDYIL